MERVFIVGCPRSGTTLLQSLVASHTRIVSFPETHFFSHTLPINPLLRRLKFYGEEDRNFVRNYLSTNGFQNILPFQGGSKYKKYSHRRWTGKLLLIIDRMARSSEAEKPSVWIEKTPRHLHYISSITVADPDVKFLHMLRNGTEVVASLHLATKKYPEEWGGLRSIDKCIKWWNRSIKASIKYKDQPNHLFVTYDRLITHPEEVLDGICHFLSVDYEPDMLRRYHKTAQNLTGKKEKWKSRNTEISLQKSNKLHENFDAETIEYIDNRILAVDLDQVGNY